MESVLWLPFEQVKAHSLDLLADPHRFRTIRGGQNTITGTVFAFVGQNQNENAASGGIGYGAAVAKIAMGRPTTWGRRTADIMSLNLAGKGGLPQALSSSSRGAQGFLGRLGVSLNWKLIGDAILTVSEGISCSFER
jgi:hypothetical protein